MTKIEFIMDLVNAGCDLRKLSKDTIETIDYAIPDVKKEIDPKLFTDIIAAVNNTNVSTEDRERYYIDEITFAAATHNYRQVIYYFNQANENLSSDIYVAQDNYRSYPEFEADDIYDEITYLSGIRNKMDDLKKLVDLL